MKSPKKEPSVTLPNGRRPSNTQNLPFCANGDRGSPKPRHGRVSPSQRYQQGASPKTVMHSKSPSPVNGGPVVPNAYAGAKYNEPPSPKVLPKPPVHWFMNEENKPPRCDELTNHLKFMLKVQA
ncbi:proline-rich nuclear receptor coactivator 2-like [Lingula anatina]|uniref:Proline-rich nuclear receptor coactivator 2-like n=1 Tax=Lingula anatina TaxID=7574 RepID=A0A1S3HDE9_LINAN|nr:proline-rich nuclear receptor coactivator 2-like [Lingula anatina]|eukprot:XP_013383119.1 proline-rich nuclear receptor coactivator 2-like [Lingula anatina]